MSSRGLSQVMRMWMGPRGDSPVASEKDMCPAKAACLFR